LKREGGSRTDILKSASSSSSWVLTSTVSLRRTTCGQ
jgi:hypothetical protein